MRPGTDERTFDELIGFVKLEIGKLRTPMAVLFDDYIHSASYESVQLIDTTTLASVDKDNLSIRSNIQKFDSSPRAMYERCQAGVRKALSDSTISKSEPAADIIRHLDLSMQPNGIDDLMSFYEQIGTPQLEGLTKEVQQVAATGVEVPDATMSVDQQIEPITLDEKCYQQDTTTQFALALTHLQATVWLHNNATTSRSFMMRFHKEFGVRTGVSLGDSPAHDSSSINELYEKLLGSQKKYRRFFELVEGNIKTAEHKFESVEHTFKSGVASLLHASRVADSMTPVLLEHSQNQSAVVAASKSQ